MPDQRQAPAAPAGEDTTRTSRPGLKLQRLATRAGTDGSAELRWDRRNAVLTGSDGKEVFRQDGVHAPASWSDRAVTMVAEKYFRGHVGQPNREHSIERMVSRVVRQIHDWGLTGGYFQNENHGETFAAELTHLMLTQKASFNSPVWFNGGTCERPQMSACFINGVEDTMNSIMDLAKIEGMLFQRGSGTGTNLSPLRSSGERLKTGGSASGPVSFMRGFDAFAGVIKSGGNTRRAAKMVVLNADHPDIREFIACKLEEERKATALAKAGWDASFDGSAYDSVFFQNANNSVRVTDAFMKRANQTDGDRSWPLRRITDGSEHSVVDARDLLNQMAEAAHACGDPGVQFDDTTNAWHTCPETARINASNPCSEYMFLDDSACNLASLNLLSFVDDGRIDTDRFTHAIETMTLAQEIIVGGAGYPTDAITRNSRAYRPLGLGFTNLGCLLMVLGLPYDSDEARRLAGALTSLMTGTAYAMSALIARHCGGPFEGYQKNAAAFMTVIEKHQNANAVLLTALRTETRKAQAPTGIADNRPRSDFHSLAIAEKAERNWVRAIELGPDYGFRNAQATVIAPTGTISLMMDCETTGIEPELALVKHKKLVGGGTLHLENQQIRAALKSLGYEAPEIERITDTMKNTGSAEEAAAAGLLDSSHLPVFDCALRPTNGTRAISADAHLKMVAAVQPFVSGAVSKTINLPNDATVEDIKRIYVDAWKLGLKSVSVYRDGSKGAQPLVAGGEKTTSAPGTTLPRPSRRKLPDERSAITHKFNVGGTKGYVTVGLYPDGRPGEMFLTMAKEGSTISGFSDAFSQAVSYALQYGVPLEVLIGKFSHIRFEPSGMTGNKHIGIAKSIIDYVFRWMALKFLPEKDRLALGAGHAGPSTNGSGSATTPATDTNAAGPSAPSYANDLDAPACQRCGTIMMRSGTCYSCQNCGSTSGCG